MLCVPKVTPHHPSSLAFGFFATLFSARLTSRGDSVSLARGSTPHVKRSPCAPAAQAAPTVARRGRAANAGVVATRLESSQGRAMLSQLSTVFARTAEDEVIDEDKKTRLMERRLARGTARRHRSPGCPSVPMCRVEAKAAA